MKISRKGFLKIYETKTHMRTTYKVDEGIGSSQQWEAIQIAPWGVKKAKKTVLRLI